VSFGVVVRGGARAAVRIPVLALLALLTFASSAHGAKTIGGYIGETAYLSASDGVGGRFNQPRDVAVYEGLDGDPATDRIFVVEGNGNNSSRVQRLDVDGNFELMWGRNVIRPDAPGDLGDAFEICTVAADCQGNPSGALGGMFDDPQSLAVNQATGRVYVRDRDNRRVQEFDLDGNFVRAWGWDVVQTGGLGDDAVAPVGEFEICTIATECQAGSTGAGAGQFASSTATGVGIAVSPATGDVFAADPGTSAAANRRVLQFSATGAFVRAWGYGIDTGAAQFQVCTTTSGCNLANTAGTANGQFASAQPLRIAVDSSNVVYASDSAVNNRVVRFDADLAPIEGAPGTTFPHAGPVADGGSGALLAPIAATIDGGPLLNSGNTPTLGLEVDPDNDGGGADTERLLVARDPATAGEDTLVQELQGLDTTPALAPDGNHVFAPQAANGLGLDSVTGNLYLAISIAPPTGPGAGLIVLSAAGADPPTATVSAPSDVTATSATLQGTINPHGAARYRFEYSSDGVSWTAAGPDRYISGGSSVPTSATVTGLEPNTVYRVRIVASKQTSLTTVTSAMSAEASFMTDAAPPDATTLGSADRTDTSAQLRGLVDPNGSATSYRFEYGPAGGSFDNSVPVPDASAGSGNSPEMVVQQVTGLLPATAYHYRIVATSAIGADVGDPVTFTTESPSGPAQPQERGYELVSPAYKAGGAGVGTWYSGPGSVANAGFAAYDGERFAASGGLGSVLLDGAQAYANDWAFAERANGEVGWLSHSPLTHPNSGHAAAQFIDIHSAADDLSALAWRTNNFTASVFPELAFGTGWESFNASLLGDWDGRWEVFAPRDLGQVAPDPGGNGDGQLWEMVHSSDGSHAVGATDLENQNSPRRSVVAGLAGPGDPTSPGAGELTSGRSVYLADVSAGLVDAFAPMGDRELVNACTGAGAARTALPARQPSGKLAAEACPAATAGLDARLISTHGATLRTGDAGLGVGVGEGSLTNVISADGSRTFFMSPDPLATGAPDGIAGGAGESFCSGTGASSLCPTQLYVRQRNGDGSVTTRWISHAEQGLLGLQDATLTGTTRFEGATPDGDKVLFRTNAPLTADDPNGAGVAPPGGVTTGTASGGSWDLYMYDLPDAPGADPGAGELTRISAGPTGAGDCNSPLASSESVGALRFVSDDGSRVYFACAAPLPGVPVASGGTVTLPGGTTTDGSAVNLYLYDANHADAADRWRFIARLPRSVGGDISACASTAVTPGMQLGGGQAGDVTLRDTPYSCVRGTSDGSFVTFWTDGRLTADDPVAPATADVYGYDAATDELTRITAAQGGVGGTYPCGTSGPAASLHCYGDMGTADSDVIARMPKPFLGVATDPVGAGDRVAFFESRSRLVADDVDDAYDVYEWHDGELSLVSTGASDTDGAFYKGNDASGLDVYFATRDVLTWQDVDAVADVYTARVGGGIPQPPPPPVCAVLGGACQGPDAAPSPTQIESEGATAGNPSTGARAELSVAPLSRAARRRAARTGVVPVRVRVSAPGAIAALAKARVGGRRRTVGRAGERVAQAGREVLELRLRKAARDLLRSGRALRLSIRVTADGARPQTLGATLRRPGQPRRGGGR
jgi:hypothetical protein